MSQVLPTPVDGGGSGGGAPTTSQYVLLAPDASLPSERVLTQGTNVTITDAGAGSTVTVAALSGSMKFNTATATTTPYNVASTDNVVFCNPSAAQSVVLPAASASAGRVVTIKRISINAYAITVSASSGNIDGAANRTLNNYESITLISDGSNWWAV